MTRRKGSSARRRTSRCSSATTLRAGNGRRKNRRSQGAGSRRPGRSSASAARFFADCTGHGFIGEWAGADLTMKEKGRMGMSNMWMWEKRARPVEFPRTSRGCSFDEKGFPYPRRGHAEWFWESGFDKHPVKRTGNHPGLESGRRRSARGTRSRTARPTPRAIPTDTPRRTTWLAYVGGTRETQQLLGDVVLSGDDIDREKGIPRRLVLHHLEHRPALSAGGIHRKRCRSIRSSRGRIHGKGVEKRSAIRFPTAASIRATSRTCSWPAATSV